MLLPFSAWGQDPAFLLLQQKTSSNDQSSEINGTVWVSELPEEECCSGYEGYYWNVLIICCVQLLVELFVHGTLFIVIFTGHLGEQMPCSKRIRRQGKQSGTVMCHVPILLKRKHVLKSYASAVAETQMWWFIPSSKSRCKEFSLVANEKVNLILERQRFLK